VSAHSAVTSEPLQVAAHEALVAHESAGAVVSFAGVVRDHDGGRGVTRLVYEAHPSAADVLAEIAAQIAKDPHAMAVAVSHRVGELAVGEVALAAAVSSAHRAEAFDLCARLVNEVKARLPVWKHQFFTDGTDKWLASP
jgi:molybdopterin synthase catalytic subunit